MDDLQRLRDRAAISDTVIQYATGIDHLRWDLYRDCFTDPVEIDFSSFSGRPGVSMAADDWVGGVRSLQVGFDATQHISTNHVITFESDDVATCVSYMQATHQYDGPVVVLGGFYTNTLRRETDRWRISRCQLTVTWRTGDEGLFEKARQRAGERLAAGTHARVTGT